MPEAIVKIRTLLAKQLEALRDGMHTMSSREWSEYYRREEEIAALIAGPFPQRLKTLAVAQPAKPPSRQSPDADVTNSQQMT